VGVDGKRESVRKSSLGSFPLVEPNAISFPLRRTMVLPLPILSPLI
jgi:hypothetical protein